jgi:DNA-binding protein HU-beta
MNKSELIDHVAEAAELSKVAANNAINAVFDGIRDALKKGEIVTLIGFGNFMVRDRAAREGRNPQTGKTIQINASKAAVFKAGKALKDAVQHAGKDKDKK